MYDVHCHILPDIDDGARNLDMALAMARIAVDDGITHMACTPHIYPTLFENTPQGIESAVNAFRHQLEINSIPLELNYGADIQVVPELVSHLHSGTFPSICGSRYFLFEPPHHVPLVHFQRFIDDSLSAGFVPVITHPERLTWIDGHYQEFVQAAEAGAWIQITAGSVAGRFGKEPGYWSERMLDDGIVHVLATDAHNTRSRAPLLAEARAVAAKIVGESESWRLVLDRPRMIWQDADPGDVVAPHGFNPEGLFVGPRKKGVLRWLSRFR